jgi:NADH-quinone oxidoreductase subunit K
MLNAAQAEIHLLQNYLLIGGLLFAIGLVGFLSRRNMIVMFLAAEMMLQGVSVSLVGWGRFHDDWGGQMLVIFILTVAACEAAIALALVQMLFHRGGNLDIALWQNLRESNQPRYVDREVPEADESKPTFPTLTPAGIDPKIKEEDTIHRSHV